jgi:hypothetical protein
MVLKAVHFGLKKNGRIPPFSQDSGLNTNNEPNNYYLRLTIRTTL